MDFKNNKLKIKLGVGILTLQNTSKRRISLAVCYFALALRCR